jgi:hypothetical protein
MFRGLASMFTMFHVRVHLMRVCGMGWRLLTCLLAWNRPQGCCSIARIGGLLRVLGADESWEGSCLFGQARRLLIDDR